MGVDIPDIYSEIYSRSDPHHEKIKVISLEIILDQLSGLPMYTRQEVRKKYKYLFKERKRTTTPNTKEKNQVIRLVTSPEAEFVTRNEFNSFLALIACGQKNLGK